MAKKARKRPTRRAGKSKKSAARSRRSAPKRKASARKPKVAAKAKSTRKAPRRAAKPAKKAAPIRLTAKAVRQREVAARPVHRVEVDEERARLAAETILLGKKGFETDDLSEEMGEAFVMGATSGEQADEDMRDQEVPEETGGPFVETKASTEFGMGVDESNPADAEPAALPTSSASEPD